MTMVEALRARADARFASRFTNIAPEMLKKSKAMP